VEKAAFRYHPYTSFTTSRKRAHVGRKDVNIEMGRLFRGAVDGMEPCKEGRMALRRREDHSDV